MKANQTTTAAEIKRKLSDLKERLDNKAADFAELAKTYSADSSSAKGGDVGWVLPGDTAPEFEAAMNKLALNEVSEPVETSYGWHIIQVIERKDDDSSKEKNV